MSEGPTEQLFSLPILTGLWALLIRAAWPGYIKPWLLECPLIRTHAGGEQEQENEYSD